MQCIALNYMYIIHFFIMDAVKEEFYTDQIY